MPPACAETAKLMFTATSILKPETLNDGAALLGTTNTVSTEGAGPPVLLATKAFTVTVVRDIAGMLSEPRTAELVVVGRIALLKVVEAAVEATDCRALLTVLDRRTNSEDVGLMVLLVLADEVVVLGEVTKVDVSVGNATT